MLPLSSQGGADPPTVSRLVALSSRLIFSFIGAAKQSARAGPSTWVIRKLKSIYPFYALSNFAPSNLTTEKDQTH